MPTLPIVFTTEEGTGFPARLKQEIDSSKYSNYLLKYPTVYIHYWQGKTQEYTDKHGVPHSIPRYHVYVGESNDVIERTKQHYQEGNVSTNWQYQLTHSRTIPQMVVVGYEHFNKSFTLDVENRLIEYIMSMDSLDTLHNGRGNPQNSYYPDSEFEHIFSKVWQKLTKLNPSLFRSESEIEHSAIFKASPLKKLTEEQIFVKESILAKIADAYSSGKEGQLIIVQGEAGTGKTVLNSSLFYDLIVKGEELIGKNLDCHLMVNHDQQYDVYKKMAERLNLGPDVVHKPTSFINKYSKEEKVDLSFIDEGHLLLTQGKQSYRGKNQLADIIDRSRVTVMMFDEYQILTAEEYWEPAVLESFKSLSIRQGNYLLALSNQLRMHCSEATAKWLNNFTLNHYLGPLGKDPDYDIRLFDSPQALHAAIKAKAEIDDSRLSRVVASYDWAYSNINRPKKDEGNGVYWGVKIGDWFLPWNYETKDELSRSEKRRISDLAWAEQPHTIDEVGSTFTIQGFDLSYVGVILGPSVKYRNGEIVFDPTASKNDKATNKRTLQDGTKQSFATTFIRNEVKVLLTRGVKGLYLYACDKELRDALKEMVEQ